MVGLSGSSAEPRKGARAGQTGQAVLPGFIRSRFAGLAWDFNQRPPDEFSEELLRWCRDSPGEADNLTILEPGRQLRRPLGRWQNATAGRLLKTLRPRAQRLNKADRKAHNDDGMGPRSSARRRRVDEISRHVAQGAHAVLLLDHTTGALHVPENIAPIFLPWRAPDATPVENVWQYLRSNWLANRVVRDLRRDHRRRLLSLAQLRSPRPGRGFVLSGRLGNARPCIEWFRSSVYTGHDDTIRAMAKVD